MASTSIVFDILANDRASATFSAFGKEIDGIDKKMRGLNQLGDTGGKIGLAAAAGLVAIVGVSANFEKAMSGVKAATGETEAGMDSLREAALQAGADTAFSASEAAGAIEALSKAGVETSDILGGGLSGALDLAAAGSIDVSVAAETAASAMTQFGLSGEDVPHIADLLAAAAGKAQGEVTDMAAALNQAGLVADQVGLSIEETTGGLAAFASAGLIGSDAGTSFKTMLGALTGNSVRAKEEMERLGISAYDAQGNFIGLTQFAGVLEDKLSTLSDEQRNAALKTIFGSDAVRAASILYEQGADGIQSWIDKTNDSGFAAEQAATQLDNLAGDFEALRGSLETALIGAGSGAQGPLRKLVQTLTDVTNAFNGLPGPAQSAVTGLLGITAVLGGGLWFTSKVVQGIANTAEALSDLGIKADRTKTAMAGLGKGVQLGALLLIIPQVEDALENLFNTRLDDSALSRDLASLATGKTVGEVEKLASWISLLDDNMAEFNQTVFGKLPGTDSLSLAEEELGKVDAALAAMVESGNADQAASIMAEIAGIAEEQGTSVNQLSEVFGEYQQALQNAGEAQQGFAGGVMQGLIDNALGASTATRDLAGATDDLGGSSKSAAGKVRDLAAAMMKQRDAALAAFDAETAYREALKSARDAANKNSAGIRGNSDAALDNRNALSGLAAAWNNQSEATRNNTAKFREAKTAFIQTAVAMGVPKQAAQELARELLALPKSKVIPVSTPGAEGATNAVHGLITALSNVRDKTVHITTVFERHNITTGNGGGGTGATPRSRAEDAPILPGPAIQEIGRVIAEVARAATKKTGAFHGIGAGIVNNLLHGLNSGNANQAQHAVDRMMRAIEKALDDEEITKAAAKRMRATVLAMEREAERGRAAIEKRLSFANTLRDSFKSELDLGSIVESEDFAGIGSLTGGAQSLATRLQAFAVQLRELKQEGMPKGLIAEIASLGSVKGSEAAAAILSGSRSEQQALASAFGAYQQAAGFASNTAANAVHGTVRQIKHEYHVEIKVNAGHGANGKEIGNDAARAFEQGLHKLARSEGRRLIFQASP